MRRQNIFICVVMDTGSATNTKMKCVNVCSCVCSLWALYHNFRLRNVFNVFIKGGKSILWPYKNVWYDMSSVQTKIHRKSTKKYKTSCHFHGWKLGEFIWNVAHSVIAKNNKNLIDFGKIHENHKKWKPIRSSRFSLNLCFHFQQWRLKWGIVYTVLVACYLRYSEIRTIRIR